MLALVALFVFILGFSWGLGSILDHDGMLVFRAASANPDVEVNDPFSPLDYQSTISSATRHHRDV